MCDESLIAKDGTTWGKKLQRGKYPDGGLVTVAFVGREVTGDTLRWGYVLEQKDRHVKVRITRCTPASHPVGPLGEWDDA